MKLVIDTNILLSALIRDGTTRKLLLDSNGFTFFYPEDSLVYYAAPYFDESGDETYHADIEECFSLEKVLGGGACTYIALDKGIMIYGKSNDFGGVPMRILEIFKPKLEEAYGSPIIALYNEEPIRNHWKDYK